jgi:AcrR family transcriptional regulator
MEQTGSTAKRPYLRPTERRRQLLDAANAVVERDGFSSLTMVAVTAQAGVSRRLLYNHFPDLATLVREYIVDRLSTYLQDSEPSFDEHRGNPRALAREIFFRILHLAPEDRQLLRTILSGSIPRELLPVRVAVEQTIVSRWERALPDGADRRLALARLLILAQVALTLAELVERGDVTVDEASDLLRDSVNLVPGIGS